MLFNRIIDLMNTYSQFGQAEWLLNFSNSIGLAQGVVFEAGAHTPKSISNSMCFIEAGWRAILVEPYQKHCGEWRDLNLNNVDIHCRGINYDQNGLEMLLTDISAPRDIDVFFLDIDGGEYQLLNGLHQYRPKLLCVEYDNSYPLTIDFVPKQIRHGIQSSSLAMYNLMTSKGYTYLRSFFHDHIFIDNGVLSNVTDKIQFPIGDEAFISTASQSLYQFHAVLLNQQENQGGSGIDFYSSKVANLIENGCIKEAKNYYFMLSQVFHSYSVMVRQIRGDSYFQFYHSALEKFDKSYSRCLFYV